MLFTVCVSLIAMLLGSCATYSPAVSSTAAVNAGNAYLYGKFNMAKSWNTLKMGLVVKNLTSDREYTIRLKKQDDIYAVRVEPGEYAITGLSYATGEGVLSGGKSFTGRYSIPTFHVASGNAYYIGNYFGAASTNVAVVGSYVNGNYRWALTQVNNDFEQTTRILVTINPGFSSLVSVNTFAKGELETAFGSVLDHGKE
jgi:hypothetical protein